MTVPLAHALLRGEKEADYNWAFDCYRELYEEYGMDSPSVILHDRDRAMINSIKSKLPEMEGHHMLCMWHINSDVEAQASDKLGRVRKSRGDKHTVLSDEGAEFMSMYRAIINALTEDEYHAALKELRVRAYGDSDSEYDTDDPPPWIRLFAHLRRQ